MTFFKVKKAVLIIFIVLNVFAQTMPPVPAAPNGSLTDRTGGVRIDKNNEDEFFALWLAEEKSYYEEQYANDNRSLRYLEQLDQYGLANGFLRNMIISYTEFDYGYSYQSTSEYNDFSNLGRLYIGGGVGVSGVGNSFEYQYKMTGECRFNGEFEGTLIWNDLHFAADLDSKTPFTSYISGIATIDGRDVTQKYLNLLIGGTSNTSISNIQKSNARYGIRFSENIVSDKAEISIVLPNGETVRDMSVTIYDMVGNVVFTSAKKKEKIVWNLVNNSGRIVANGAYLVVAKANSVNGKSYAFSAKMGVKR